MNQTRLINRFARAVTTYESEAVVQATAADRLVEAFGKHFHALAPRILEIGCGTGLLTRQVMNRFAPSELYLNDICQDMSICFKNLPRTTFIPGDVLSISFPHTLDAIVSASAVQWLSDLKAFAQKCAAHLAPQGILAITSFGPATLQEIRMLTGEGLDYISFDAFKDALNTAFEPLETDRWIEQPKFEDAMAVLRHLKATGVTASATNHSVWTRSRLADLAERYAAQFSIDHGVVATYEPFLYIGRRK